MTSRKTCRRSRFFILCPIVLVAVFLLVDRNYIPSPMIIGSSDRCDPKPGSTRSPTGSTRSPTGSTRSPTRSTRSPDRTYPMPASEPDSSDENDPFPGALPPDVHLDPVKKVGDPDRLHPNPGDAPERLPLYRNLHFQEAWPAVQYPKAILPGRVSTGPLTTTVAFACLFLWCPRPYSTPGLYCLAG